MKNFLSKNWKRMLIIIGIVIIIINVGNKIIAPHSLIGDFAKYGPEAKIAISGKSINTENIVDKAKTASNLSDDMFHVIATAIIVIVGTMIFTDIISKKPATKKK